MGPRERAFIDSFMEISKRCPSRVHVDFEGRHLSFGELARDANTLAAYLSARGIRPGARVAVMMNNSLAQIKVVFALARAGITWVPVHSRLRAGGLRYILNHCDPAAIVCDNDLFAEIRSCGLELDSTHIISAEADLGADASLESIWTKPSKCSVDMPSCEDLFAIMYTSGTTGRPKGVLVTYAMMMYAAEAAAAVAGVRDGDVMFVWEPIFHIGGAQMLLLPIIRNVTLAAVSRFSASRFWGQVYSSGATHVHYLGGVLQILLKQPVADIERDHAVRVFWGGGCKVEHWRLFEDRFGVEIRECYGMTEAASITTSNVANVLGSVGKPVPWLLLEVLRPDGNPAAVGERGEIVVRANSSSALFSGYFRDPQATAQSLKHGALFTGDAGSLDAMGNLWFHGRLGDSVRVNGENVSAWDVEHVALTHPAVEDCAMIGVAAEVGEQSIKLFVQLRPDQYVERDDFVSWLEKRLARHQMPAYLARVESFTRTPSERIMKHLLPTDPENDWW